MNTKRTYDDRRKDDRRKDDRRKDDRRNDTTGSGVDLAAEVRAEMCPVQAVLRVLQHDKEDLAVPEAAHTESGSAPFKFPVLHRATGQIFAFTLFAFCTLGPFNGLNALGGGGLRDHLLATKINCLYNMCLTLLGWLGGAAFNHFGCRSVNITASLCFMTYVVVLAGVIFGNWTETWTYAVGPSLAVGASLLWAAFGAISLRYPPLRQQPSNFANMWSMINLGGFFCGGLAFITNRHLSATPSEASLASYLCLAGLACFGLVVAIMCLRHQNTVFRKDHSLAGPPDATTSLHAALKAAVKMLKDPQLRPLWPIFLAPLAHFPFLFNGLNGHVFNIRTRGLNSSLYWISRIPGGYIFYVIARPPSTQNDQGLRDCMARRLMPGLYCTLLWAALTLALAYFCASSGLGSGAESTRIDYMEDFPRSLLLMSPFAAFGILDSLWQSLIYNMLGFMAGADLTLAALYAGLYKSLQSLTLGVMWGLDWYCDAKVSPPARYRLHWVVMCVLWTLAFPGTLRKLLRLRRMPHHDKQEEALRQEEIQDQKAASRPKSILYSS